MGEVSAAVRRVHAEFTRWSGWPERRPDEMTTHWIDTDAMALAIVNLRRENAALRDAIEDCHA